MNLHDGQYIKEAPPSELLHPSSPHHQFCVQPFLIIPNSFYHTCHTRNTSSTTQFEPVEAVKMAPKIAIVYVSLIFPTDELPSLEL